MLQLLTLLLVLQCSTALTPAEREKLKQEARMRPRNLPDVFNMTSYRTLSCGDCKAVEKCHKQPDGELLCVCPYTHLTLQMNKQTNKIYCAATMFFSYWKIRGSTGNADAVMTDRPMTQEKSECELYIKDGKHGPFSECFQGTYGFHQVLYGVYTCDFGSRFGRLFVSLSDTYGKACEHDHSTDLATGRHFFVPANTNVTNMDTTYFPFSIDSGRLWHYNSGCLVNGFYCIIEDI